MMVEISFSFSVFCSGFLAPDQLLVEKPKKICAFPRENLTTKIHFVKVDYGSENQLKLIADKKNLKNS
jgi:hypothetical protein